MTTTLVLTLNLFAGAYFLMEKKDLVDIGDQENQWSNDKFSRPSMDLLEKTVALSRPLSKSSKFFCMIVFGAKCCYYAENPNAHKFFLVRNPRGFEGRNFDICKVTDPFDGQMCDR